MSPDPIHTVAQAGFGTGTNELYDRVRPTYQKFALDHIRNSVRAPAPWNIVEIGSGTGIFTRALLADEHWNASLGSLKAYEPSEGMRSVFLKSVDDKRITVSHGTFDSTNVEGGWADMVVVAQAFHWCLDYQKAFAEFSRVLKPGGVVAFVWNLEDREGAEWVAKVRETIEAHEQDTPQFRHMYWRKGFSTPAYLENFEAPEEQVWTYTLPTTEDVVVDRASSKSYIAVLPGNEKAVVRQTIRDILSGANKVWIDETGGVFEYPYKAWVVIARRK